MKRKNTINGNIATQKYFTIEKFHTLIKYFFSTILYYPLNISSWNHSSISQANFIIAIKCCILIIIIQVVYLYQFKNSFMNRIFMFVTHYTLRQVYSTPNFISCRSYIFEIYRCRLIRFAKWIFSKVIHCLKANPLYYQSWTTQRIYIQIFQTIGSSRHMYLKLSQYCYQVQVNNLHPCSIHLWVSSFPYFYLPSVEWEEDPIEIRIN